MWPRSVWPRTCHLQFASPFIIRCAARLVIAFKTVLLMVSDVVAVSLGTWLASVPPFNHLLLPLPLIPFLLFLHASDSVSFSGADPSMSADEEENEPDFFDLSASESGSCSGDNECSVLFPLLCWFPVPGSVLLRLHLLRLLVWHSSLLLSPPSISRTTSLMSCRVNLILLLPRGLRSCCFKVRFCICKVFCYKVRYFLLPLSVFLLLKSPFLLLQSLLAACLRTGKFPAVLVLATLSSNVLILNSSGTLVLSPAPLKEWIRSPLSIRSFREISSSSGSEEESVFYAVWVYCFWKCCWPPTFWSAAKFPGQ